MPVTKTASGQYKWGNSKPTTKAKAEAIGRAAYASGYKKGGKK